MAKITGDDTENFRTNVRRKSEGLIEECAEKTGVPADQVREWVLRPYRQHAAGAGARKFMATAYKAIPIDTAYVRLQMLPYVNLATGSLTLVFRLPAGTRIPFR